MECHCLKHSEIPHTTRLFTDFLYHFDNVRDFYAHAPLDPASFQAASRQVSYPAEVRQEVVAVLEEQGRRFGLSEPSLGNIERLRRGAWAAVTGQQVGLFGGPVFSFYKALTTVRLAETLTAQGLDTVPVFWLATEDHDLEEVNHTFLLDRDYQVEQILAPAQPPVPHAAVGEVAFTGEIERQVDRALALLPEGEWSAETAAALRDSYRSGETLGGSFARLMARLFGRFGVVMLDPMHPRLRALARPVFGKALESAGEIYRALAARNRELTRRGYHTQVHVTESSSLLFVRVDGQRTPLRRRDGEFVLRGERIAVGDLLAELEREPAHFSPNVLLRPVLQDHLLPTLAYVGGPAELAYFAQAGPVYEGILGRMPVVVPRSSFTLVDRQAHKLLERYGLKLSEVFMDRQHLRERMALRYLPPDLSANLERNEARLQEVLAELSEGLRKLDATLADAAARSGRKMAYQFGRLKEKAARVTWQRTQQVERDATMLKNLIHPRKTLQERVFSGITFLARCGPPLLDMLYAKTATESVDHQVVFLEC